MGRQLNKVMVRELINLGYMLLVNGTPKKLEIDLWEYILTLDGDDEFFVLEDLLSWTDRQLSFIYVL